MAMPAFNPGFAFDPEEMLRRLGQASDPAGPRDMRLGGPQPGLVPNQQPPSPFTPQMGPGALGKMIQEAGDFMGQQPGQPPAAPMQPPGTAPSPFTPMAAPQMPAFAPAQLPPKTPFEPVRVEGAIRTGMYNPAGSSPWDRSMTANSPEEELRFRQDAKYNNVLDLIRPGGIGMPGTTGPIVGLQPWEVQALSGLGGRQAGDVTNARQITSTENVAEQNRVLQLLQSNQSNQTMRDTAGLNAETEARKANLAAETSRANTATEAASRNSPQMFKAQMAAPLLAAVQGDTFKFAAAMQAYEAAMGRPGPDGSPRPVTDVVAGNSENRATQALRSLEPHLGKAGENGRLQFDPATFKANVGKVVEVFSSLPPDAQAAFARQVQTGAYGPAVDFENAVADYYARNAVVAEPPPLARGGMPSLYASQPEGFDKPLVTLESKPAATMVGRGMDTAGMVYGSGIPYNQMTFNGRQIPFDPRDIRNPNGMRAELFGSGAEAKKYAPRNAGNAAAMLRELMKLNQQPK